MGAILITGGAGFVGLNLLEALLARGEEVVVFGQEAALPPRAAAAFPKARVIQGDVNNADALRAVFRAHRIDRLLPFAAITAGPDRESTDPHGVLDVNLHGLIRTLEAARDAGGVRRVILPSSAAVYGESAYAHATLDEAATPPVPVSLYGVTKYAVERAGLRLCAHWGLDAVAARIGATYGPWERDTGLRDTLSPHLAIAQAARRGGEAVLPPAARLSYDWVYVRDLAAGLLALLDAEAPHHRVVNLASGADWAPHLDDFMGEFARAFPGFRWHVGEEVTIRFNESRPRGVMSVARAAEFGWRPRFTPREAYADYAAWVLASGEAGLG